MHFKTSLRFLFGEAFPKALPEAEATRFYHNKNDQSHYGKQKCKDIQTVVLVPAEVVGLYAQMLSSFIAHDKLNPEHGLVQRFHGLVVVNPGEPHDALLVSGVEQKDRSQSAGVHQHN